MDDSQASGETRGRNSIWSWSAVGWAALPRPRSRSDWACGPPCWKHTPSSAAVRATFDGRDYCFDVGATALSAVKPGEPIGDLLAVLGVDFRSEPTSSYRVHLPDRTLDIVGDNRAFEQRGCGGILPITTGLTGSEAPCLLAIAVDSGRGAFRCRGGGTPLASAVDRRSSSTTCAFWVSSGHWPARRRW